MPLSFNGFVTRKNPAGTVVRTTKRDVSYTDALKFDLKKKKKSMKEVKDAATTKEHTGSCSESGDIEAKERSTFS